jgi:CheY-like chemotaxis protein
MSLPDDNPTDPPDAECQVAEGEVMVQQPSDRPGVLVVDDDPSVRILVQLCLERNGFDVWLASGGRAAISLYRKHRDRIDVVLLDVRMPDLDGPKTLEALRALNPGVRACFMSGDTGTYRPEELWQYGAACLIAKPFRLEDLANVLRSMTQDASARLGEGQGDVPRVQGGIGSC